MLQLILWEDTLHKDRVNVNTISFYVNKESNQADDEKEHTSSGSRVLMQLGFKFWCIPC